MRHSRRRLFLHTLLAGALLALSMRASGQDADVRIAATPSTRRLLAAVIHVMLEEKNLHVVVDANLTSLDAIDALASEKDGLAIITRPLTGEDRAQYPAQEFLPIPIGMQVVALGVSSDVWQAGVHTISRDTMRQIYEQKITNWKQAGGPDEKIKLFTFVQGEGIWEIFAEWLYGDNRKAPLPKVQKVTNSEDARDLLEFTPGSIAPMAAALVDGSRCQALGIQQPGGVARPLPAEVAAGRYPMVRPIVGVVLGRATLGVRVVTEYLTGPEGQALIKKMGDLGLDAVPKPPPDVGY